MPAPHAELVTVVNRRSHKLAPFVRQKPRSMSSIKRDVKKKAPPRPEAEIVSRDPAHCRFIFLEKFGVLSIRLSLSADADDAVELRERQARWCFTGNHGSIRGSRPMAISGYPREHNV